MDYIELVSALRECSKQGTRYGMAVIYMGQAADAIEELQQIADHYEECAKDYFKDVCYYMERVPKWIPVTERLPEENDDVLIYGEWMGTKYREIWLTDLKGFLYQGYKPIAWMPLPEPPKEES